MIALELLDFDGRMLGWVKGSKGAKVELFCRIETLTKFFLIHWLLVS